MATRVAGAPRPRVVARASRRATVARSSDGAFDCAHWPRCAGCVDVDAPLRPEAEARARAYFASLDARAGETGETRETHETYRGRATRWRVKAKLAARAHEGETRLGLFARGSHALEPIDDARGCAVSAIAVERAMALVREVCASMDVKGYDETTGNGELRYAQIVAQTRTAGQWDAAKDEDARAAISLVWNARKMTPRAMAVCEEIARKGGDFVHGTWVNAQDARNNVIFNNDGWHHATGERETHSYTPNGTKVFYLPGSFMQANAEAYGELLKRMPRHVPKNARVVEMYAGVGAIGFSLLTNDALGVKSLRCVESSSAVAEAWERTRGELPEDLRGRASLQVEKAERIAVESTKDCDVLIVDPPRKGLDAKLRAVLTDVDGLSDDLQTLLYVSCGFESFMRDSDELLASGVWQIRHHESFVFFPGTNHIEIFAVFSRTPY